MVAVTEPPKTICSMRPVGTLLTIAVAAGEFVASTPKKQVSPRSQMVRVSETDGAGPTIWEIPGDVVVAANAGTAVNPNVEADTLVSSAIQRPEDCMRCPLFKRRGCAGRRSHHERVDAGNAAQIYGGHLVQLEHTLCLRVKQLNFNVNCGCITRIYYGRAERKGL